MIAASRRSSRRRAVAAAPPARRGARRRLLVQGYEWVRLVGYGLTVSSACTAPRSTRSSATHAVHVVAAVVWLGVTCCSPPGAHGSPRPNRRLRACAIYWHFVVALWPILYVTVYLL